MPVAGSHPPSWISCKCASIACSGCPGCSEMCLSSRILTSEFRFSSPRISPMSRISWRCSIPPWGARWGPRCGVCGMAAAGVGAEADRPAGWPAGRCSGCGDCQGLSPGEYGSGLIILFTFHFAAPRALPAALRPAALPAIPVGKRMCLLPVLFAGAMVDCR